MLNNLSSDILSTIFSYLPPDSLARAKVVCRSWHTCANSAVRSKKRGHHPAWFLSVPTHENYHSQSLCYAHNPINNNWHTLLLDFVPTSFRPIASINGLILIKLTTSIALQLAICNPFTRQFKQLPKLNITRTTPALGIIQSHPSRDYKVYVAGGMCEASSGGGASYEPTVEMYDSCNDKFTVITSMPIEFAVRLTVWTSNEGVYCDGILYWITAARAYSVMRFEIETSNCRALRVPMADKLEFAALVRRKGKLNVVGGIRNGEVCVWELGEGEEWVMIASVPIELEMRFLGGGKKKKSWCGTKGVGIDEEGGGVVCLYRDLESGMIVWKENLEKGGWKWFWCDGYCSSKSKKIQNCSVRGMLLHPNLDFDP